MLKRTRQYLIRQVGNHRRFIYVHHKWYLLTRLRKLIWSKHKTSILKFYLFFTFSVVGEVAPHALAIVNKRSLQGYSWEDGRLRHVLARSVVIFVHMCSEERKTAMDIDKPHAHAERQTTFILAKLMCLMPLVRTLGRSFEMPVEPAMQHCTRIRSSTSKTPTREVALSHVGGETLSTERRRRSRRNTFEAQKCISAQKGKSFGRRPRCKPTLFMHGITKNWVTLVPVITAMKLFSVKTTGKKHR